MLYLPLQKTKYYLIILFALITIHIIFCSTKNYTVLESPRLYKASEMQYKSVLYSLSTYGQTNFINHTSIKYLFGIQEEFILLIYLGYFLLAAGIIFMVKINLEVKSNEV